MGLEDGVALFEGGLLASMPGGLEEEVVRFLVGTAIGSVELLGCRPELPALRFVRKGCPKNWSKSMRSQALRFSSPIRRSAKSWEVPEGILQKDGEVKLGIFGET
jgi:hypothetical protein